MVFYHDTYINISSNRIQLNRFHGPKPSQTNLYSFLYRFLIWESMYPRVPMSFHRNPYFLYVFLTWKSMNQQVPIRIPIGIHASYIGFSHGNPCTHRFLLDSHRNPCFPYEFLTWESMFLIWISHMGIHVPTGSYMDPHRNPCFLYEFLTWESMYPQVPIWIPIGIHIFLWGFL